MIWHKNASKPVLRNTGVICTICTKVQFSITSTHAITTFPQFHILLLSLFIHNSFSFPLSIPFSPFSPHHQSLSPPIPYSSYFSGKGELFSVKCFNGQSSEQMPYTTPTQPFLFIPEGSLFNNYHHSKGFCILFK